MDQGYAGYYDAGNDEAMAGFEFLGAVGAMAGTINESQRPLPYVPDLQPVGSGNAYFPRSVDDDATALNVLGFAAGFPGGGVSQSSDQSRGEGAFDPTFQAAVKRFQASRGIKADGWIGPQTRAQLGLAVVAFNASPAGQPLVLPGGLVIPGLKPPAPAPGAPAAADNTLRNVGIGAGVLALVVGGYFLLK